ncbi:MAG: hypothetical protein KC419_10510, partial [Anaerolineales bacterium]|nr:hypothetical protein [Anaerolineales bacterium]
MRKLHLILPLLFAISLFACDQANETPTPTTIAEKPAPTAAPTNTAVSTPTPPPHPTPTVTQNTAVPTQSTEHAWPPPAKTYSEFSRQPITQAEQLTFDILETDLPPDRDDVALAVAYRGITVPPDSPPLVTEPQSVGTSQPFFVSTYDTNVTTSPEFL